MLYILVVITCIISYVDDILMQDQSHVAIQELHRHSIFVSGTHFCVCKHHNIIVKFLLPQPLLLLFNFIPFNGFFGKT
jgi:hypothetical protein